MKDYHDGYEITLRELKERMKCLKRHGMFKYNKKYYINLEQYDVWLCLECKNFLSFNTSRITEHIKLIIDDTIWSYHKKRETNPI
jgi:hypothetical protein